VGRVKQGSTIHTDAMMQLLYAPLYVQDGGGWRLHHDAIADI
jgi:hypothetical protein